MDERMPVELQVFHPRQKDPESASNVLLEQCVRDIVGGSSRDDVQMRFFGIPNTEAVAGRVTGRIADRYEQPRDVVVVAFASHGPVGYVDISRFSEQSNTAELSIMVRSDMQRRGIGKTMLLETIRVLREEGVTRLEAYIHPDNSKMQKAFQKWSRSEELRDVTFRRAVGDGEVIYTLDFKAV